MYYYLKANSNNLITQINICNWIAIAACEDKDAKIYLVCDNQKLIDDLSSIYPSHFNLVEVIPSEIDSDILNKLVSATISSNWSPAGYAHLTTFLHATRNGYSAFWNIDADDTYMAASCEKTKEILKDAESLAKEKGIDALSLDMHYTRLGGVHWSFGITYIDNTVDWFDIMAKYVYAYQDMKEVRGVTGSNLDWFFTYLKSHSGRRLESFYVENLRFIHSTGAILMHAPWYTGVYYWENGRLISPFIKDVLGILAAGDLAIPEDVICLKTSISREESIKMLQRHVGVRQYVDMNLSNFAEEACREMDPFLSGTVDESVPVMEYDSCSIDDKTIVLMPYSEICKPLPGYFWELLAQALKTMGYRVVTAVGKRIIPIKNTEPFISYNEEEQLGNALAVIAVRNYACDKLQNEKTILFAINFELIPDPEGSFEELSSRDGLMSINCTTEEELPDIARTILKCF